MLFYSFIISLTNEFKVSPQKPPTTWTRFLPLENCTEISPWCFCYKYCQSRNPLSFNIPSISSLLPMRFRPGEKPVMFLYSVSFETMHTFSTPKKKIVCSLWCHFYSWKLQQIPLDSFLVVTTTTTRLFSSTLVSPTSISQLLKIDLFFLLSRQSFVGIPGESHTSD